jgi:hypothetical protein
MHGAATIFRINLSSHETDNGGEAFGVTAGAFGTFRLGSTSYSSSAIPFVDGDFRMAVV